MKKFKDFVYDKNDIIIALFILVLAALVIVWRMNAIMDYPKTLFQDTDTNTSAQGSGNQPQSAAGAGQDAEADSNNSQGADEPAQNEGTSADTQTASLWDGDVLAKDVEVNVEGTIASAAVSCLIEAGLFDDYEEYQKVCDAAGLDDEKVSAGLFVFKKGYTKKDVAAEINWG